MNNNQNNTSNALNALDCISRQAAIEAIRKLPNAGIHWFVSAEAVFDALLKLPSAQQKPLKYTGDSVCLYCQTVDCDGCVYEPMEGEQNI